MKHMDDKFFQFDREAGSADICQDYAKNDVGFAFVTTQTKDKWMSRIHWEDLDEYEVVLP